MTFYEQLERIEKQIEICHRNACDKSLSKEEHAGAILGWMDWMTDRAMLMEAMEASEGLTLIGRIKRLIRNWLKSLRGKVAA